MLGTGGTIYGTTRCRPGAICGTRSMYGADTKDGENSLTVFYFPYFLGLMYSVGTYCIVLYTVHTVYIRIIILPI